ncbi:MAG: DUF3810 domain-containing protein [Eubacteriales bacterium]|nr:DUF3810 domain-containing protein [Eubacteriales bacterium]
MTNHDQDRAQAWRRQVAKLPYLALLPLAIVLPALVNRLPAGFMRWYQARFYPAVSQAVNAATDKVPFSLAEILLYALIAVTVVYTLVQLVRLFTRRYRIWRLVAYLMNIGVAAALFYFCFMLFWGINYHGPTLARRLDLPAQPRAAAELYRLCSDLLDDCLALREQVQENDLGVFVYSASRQQVLVQSSQCYRNIAGDYAMFSARYGSPKKVAFSQGLSYCDITGIFVPITMEPNVNTDAPNLYFAATACHEMAHLYGIAREDEANFSAYLACLSADTADMRYSASMLALTHAMGQLSGTDSDGYATLRAQYSAGMERDLRNHSLYWLHFEGPVAEASTQMNNAYLRSNNQQDGVKSYGRMVDLLLAYFAQTRWQDGL